MLNVEEEISEEEKEERVQELQNCYQDMLRLYHLALHFMDEKGITDQFDTYIKEHSGDGEDEA